MHIPINTVQECGGARGGKGGGGHIDKDYC